MVVKTSAITIIPKSASKITKSSPSALTKFNKGGGKLSKINFDRPINPTGTDLGSGNDNVLVDALFETNRILVEIQNQLAIDFANRIAEQDKQLKDNKKRISKNKFLNKEAAVEGVKKVGGFVTKTAGRILKPATSIFGKLKEFGTILVTGILASNVIDWLKDPKSLDQLQEMFKWTVDNWDKLLLAATGIVSVGLIGSLGGLLTIATALKGVFVTILALVKKHPMIAAALALVPISQAQGLGKSEKEVLSDLAGDTSKENRDKWLEIYKKRRDEAWVGSGGKSYNQSKIDFLQDGKIGFQEDSTFNWDTLKIETPIKKAIGGNVFPGQAYMVNDGTGMESLLTPLVPGRILTARDTERILSMANGGSGTPNVVVIDAPVENEAIELPPMSGAATGVQPIGSRNTMNPYMVSVQELLGIDV